MTTLGYDAFLVKVLPTPAAPVFTGISTDTGTSAHDEDTSDQNLYLLGTATAAATVTLSRSDLGLLGTTTANGSGLWTYTYTGTTLLDGTYDFTATQTVSSQLSPATPDFLVTVDTTAPTVTLTDESPSDSTQPSFLIGGYDLNGLPNGTPVALLVYNSTGMTLLSTTSGTWSSNSALITVPSALTVSTTYVFKAEVTDIAGNVGTSTGQSIEIQPVGTPWPLNAEVLSSDPTLGMSEQQLGDASASHALDLDQSPGSDQSGNPALVYNSDSVSILPVVTATLQTNSGVTLPSTVSGTLVWYSTTGTPTTTTFSDTVPSSVHAGDMVTLGVQTTATVTLAGRYEWELDASVRRAARARPRGWPTSSRRTAVRSEPAGRFRTSTSQLVSISG